MNKGTDETWVTIPEDEQAAAGLNFGDKSIRRGFIRKVYSILSLQLLLTGGMIFYFVFILPQHVHYEQCQRYEYREDEYHHSMVEDQSNDSSAESKANLVDKCNKIMFASKHFWLLYVCCGVALVVMIPMMCVKTLRTKVPMNFMLLGTFTVAEAISLGIISMCYDVDAVLIAVGITTGIVLALTIFALQQWEAFSSVFCVDS